MRAWVLLVLVACAPSIDGPVERARAADRADGERLAAQLGALPGVVRAEVIVRRPVADPIAAPAPPQPPAAAVVVIVDDRADRDGIRATATALARVVARVEPLIVVEVGAERPELADVGPFRVDARSKTALRAVLAGAFLVIVVLAGWIALRYRRGSSTQ